MTARAQLYPAALLVTDCALGAVCFEAGALAVAMVLWLVAASICLSFLTGVLADLSDTAFPAKRG